MTERFTSHPGVSILTVSQKVQAGLFAKPSIFFHNIKRLIGAQLNAGRFIALRTQVASRCYPRATKIGPNSALGTRQYACPTPDTLARIVNDLACCLVLIDGAGDAGIGAIRFPAMSALQSKRAWTHFLDNDPARRRHLFLEHLDDVFGS